MKYSVTFSDLTADEARHLINQAGGQAPAGGPPASAPAPAAPGAPPPPPAPSGARPAAPPPPPPAGAPSAAPASAPAPAPAPAAPPPPSANAASPSDAVQAVLPLMQGYAKVHKSAGVKAILTKLKLTKVQDANPEQLAWLKDRFARTDLGPEV